MVSLLTVHNSEGCVGRCDAGCYMAKTPKCHCICGGKNHGVGLKRALDNNQQRVGLDPRDLEAFAQERKIEPQTLFVLDRVRVRVRNVARRILRDHFHPAPREPDMLSKDRRAG